jgi:SAM-dependent methyltransferase
MPSCSNWSVCGTPVPLGADVRAATACPRCSGTLDWGSASIDCRQCGAEYRFHGYIPILVDERDQTKQAQARYFDAVQNVEFEISRPHETPDLYRWYYEEKFERGVCLLRTMLPEWTTLTVCGGSGMDAEFLARMGSNVVTSDISVGASRRARERAARYGLSITAVVADAERLPFRDRSFDLVYVHDGLHHLERPSDALSEMARVARRAISITEPADAVVTKLAVRLGAALEREEAGNRVVRFRIDELATPLLSHGFRIVDAHRYAMYYKHEPGRLLKLLSRRPFFEATVAATCVFNRLAGGFGNRLTIQAVRRSHE